MNPAALAYRSTRYRGRRAARARSMRALRAHVRRFPRPLR